LFTCGDAREAQIRSSCGLLVSRDPQWRLKLFGRAISGCLSC